MSTGESVLYQGRRVAKDGFRAFIYGFNDLKKLVNSWDEFESYISTGVWFSTIEESKKNPDEIKELPKTRKKGRE